MLQCMLRSTHVMTAAGRRIYRYICLRVSARLPPGRPGQVAPADGHVSCHVPRDVPVVPCPRSWRTCPAMTDRRHMVCILWAAAPTLTGWRQRMAAIPWECLPWRRGRGRCIYRRISAMTARVIRVVQEIKKAFQRTRRTSTPKAMCVPAWPCRLLSLLPSSHH